MRAVAGVVLVVCGALGVLLFAAGNFTILDGNFINTPRAVMLAGGLAGAVAGLLLLRRNTSPANSKLR